MTENAYFDKNSWKIAQFYESNYDFCGNVLGGKDAWTSIIWVISRGKKIPKIDLHCQIFKKKKRVELDQNGIFGKIRWKSLKMANFMKNSIFSDTFWRYQDLWISNIGMHKYSFWG